MSIVKKVVKFVEEKECTKNKKMQRTKERNSKYTVKDTKVIEDSPQDPEKEFEEGFKEWKRSNKQAESRCMFKPIKEPTIEDVALEIMEPSVHYKQGEGEGWESDCDGWFD